MALRYLAILASACFASAASTSLAQTFPAKPIRILTSGAGGGSDLITRMIATGSSPYLGQPVIVDNRGGNAAGEALVKSAPDGYTIMLMGGTVWIAPLLYDNLSYEVLRDFAPITLADKGPNVVVVHPSVPVNSLKELIALAKAKPGVLNWSSGVNGSSGHLAGELFKSLAGVDIVRIAYKSGSLETTDLLAGRVQMAFNPAGSSVVHVRTGKLKALAIAASQPSMLTPGVPTAPEAGLPGFEAGSTHAMFANGGTPPAVINRLNQDIVRFLKLPETREKLLPRGVEPVGSSPEELGAYVRAEMARMGKLIKELGIRAG